MRLIKKIEINYLRSLYRAKLDDVGDLNVIFGRNDAGKSNVLRALNLFFNDEIEPDQWFDFDLDMSDLRKHEAREAKGKQFSWIKITFNVRPNYRKSLGNEIAVKKQWNRDGDVNTWYFPPPKNGAQQARATRFLNDIGFTYIPAIKDLEVYADLIERVYGAASESMTLQDATTQFISAIGTQTESLSNQLSTLFRDEAVLAPPTEMRRLFRSLDFAHGEDRHSLLRQKGDGIKARHLPELLRFANEHERRERVYLWGFEEPENSLDLASAEAEATRFAKFAAREDTQIFVTSHSPAFYLTESEEETTVRRFFVTKQERHGEEGIRPKDAIAKINKLEEAEKRMETAGLLQLPFVIRQLDEQRRVIQNAIIETTELREKLEKLTCPTIYVEGKHDVDIFRDAINRHGAGDVIDIRKLEGTPSNPKAFLASILDQDEWASSQPSLFLFDNDRAGRDVYKMFSVGTPKEMPQRYKQEIFVWVLPITEEFAAFAHEYEIDEQRRMFTAEFLYPSESSANLCWQLAEDAAGEKYTQELRRIHGDYWKALNQDVCIQLINAAVGSKEWFFSRGVPDGLKQKFSQGAIAEEFPTTAIDRIASAAVDVLMS